MATDQKIHINIIGTGYELNCAEVLNEHELSATKIAKSFLEGAEDKTESHATLASEYFEKLKSYRGANVLDPGQIEFWKDRKRLKTYKFHEIIQSAVLFPILNINEVKFSPIESDRKAIIFGYQEKGHLAKYTIQVKHFLIDALQFQVIEIPMFPSKLKVLYKLIYDGRELRSLKEDTVVTGTVLRMV